MRPVRASASSSAVGHQGRVVLVAEQGFERQAEGGVGHPGVDAVGVERDRPEPGALRIAAQLSEHRRLADAGLAREEERGGTTRPGALQEPGADRQLGGASDEHLAGGVHVSAATRKPMLPAELSGVFELRAATR